jgi:hypothetical protein
MKSLYTPLHPIKYWNADIVYLVEGNCQLQAPAVLSERNHHRLPFSRRLGVAIVFPKAWKTKNYFSFLGIEHD